jgi:hypothetical protein
MSPLRPEPITALYVVYDADGTHIGELLYMIRKLLGIAHCAACDITHGPRTEKPEFTRLKAVGWNVPVHNIHRDEMDASLARAIGLVLPAVAARTQSGRDVVLLGPRQLDDCGGSVETLEASVNAALAGSFLTCPPMPPQNPAASALLRQQLQQQQQQPQQQVVTSQHSQQRRPDFQVRATQAPDEVFGAGKACSAGYQQQLGAKKEAEFQHGLESTPKRPRRSSSAASPPAAWREESHQAFGGYGGAVSLDDVGNAMHLYAGFAAQRQRMRTAQDKVRDGSKKEMAASDETSSARSSGESEECDAVVPDSYQSLGQSC